MPSLARLRGRLPVPSMPDLASSGALVRSNSVSFRAGTLPSLSRAGRTGVALEFCYFCSPGCPLFLRNGSTCVRTYVVRTDRMVHEPGVSKGCELYTNRNGRPGQRGPAHGCRTLHCACDYWQRDPVFGRHRAIIGQATDADKPTAWRHSFETTMVMVRSRPTPIGMGSAQLAEPRSAQGDLKARRVPGPGERRVIRYKYSLLTSLARSV